VPFSALVFCAFSCLSPSKCITINKSFCHFRGTDYRHQLPVGTPTPLLSQHINHLDTHATARSLLVVFPMRPTLSLKSPVLVQSKVEQPIKALYGPNYRNIQFEANSSANKWHFR
jgi:hypothetical protein